MPKLPNYLRYTKSMISVFVGEDSFSIQEEISRLEKNFSGKAERVDGAELQIRDLPDLLMGSSLFSEKRLVIIRDALTGTAVAEKITEWIDRVSDDITLILVEDKIDKRSKVYKTLKDKADLREFAEWSERDSREAEKWVSEKASLAGLKLDSSSARHLVARVGNNKWRLHQAVEKLSLAEGAINTAVIDEIITPSAGENVFSLLERAFSGDSRGVSQMIRSLELQEDAYAIFGLVSSQVFQMLAIARAGASDSPSKDFGIHPFVAGKLSQHVKRLGANRVEAIARLVADTDVKLKTTSADPWLLLEKTLIQITIK